MKQNQQQWWDRILRKRRERETQVYPSKPLGRSSVSPDLGMPAAPVPKVKDPTKYLYSRHQWKIQSDFLSKIKVRPEELYRLYSPVTEEILVVKRRSAKNGVGLSWERGLLALPNISFELESGSRKPIKYGQRVAIRVKGPDGAAYLCCKIKKGEMELSLSQKTKYEWRIDGGKEGKSVKTATVVSLFNTVAQDYLDESSMCGDKDVSFPKLRV